MHFVASHQSVDVTRHRCAAGVAVVAEVAEAANDTDPPNPAEAVPGAASPFPPATEVIGTITLSLEPPRPDGPRHYRRSDVTRFGQFAVRPTLQRSGIGA